MSEMTIRLPLSLQRRLRQLARRDESSVNQFVASAIAEKLAALETASYLQKQGRSASRRKFERALTFIPDVPPVSGDEIK
jgi:predicted transcriptional regulator